MWGRGIWEEATVSQPPDSNTLEPWGQHTDSQQCRVRGTGGTRGKARQTESTDPAQQGGRGLHRPGLGRGSCVVPRGAGQGRTKSLDVHTSPCSRSGSNPVRPEGLGQLRLAGPGPPISWHSPSRGRNGDVQCPGRVPRAASPSDGPPHPDLLGQAWERRPPHLMRTKQEEALPVSNARGLQGQGEVDSKQQAWASLLSALSRHGQHPTEGRGLCTCPGSWGWAGGWAGADSSPSAPPRLPTPPRSGQPRDLEDT